MVLNSVKGVVAVAGVALAASLISIPAATPASAAFVTKRVHGFHGRFGHGCRTVRTVVHRRFGPNRFIVRRRCR